MILLVLQTLRLSEMIETAWHIHPENYCPFALTDFVPFLCQVLGVGMCWSYGRDWEVKQRMFWDTLCRLSGLTALKLDDYSMPPGKRMFPNGPDYPAGLKHFEMLRGRLHSCHFTRMLSGFPQLDSLVVADSCTPYSFSSRGADEDVDKVSLSLRGAGGLTSLSLYSSHLCGHCSRFPLKSCDWPGRVWDGSPTGTVTSTMTVTSTALPGCNS